MPKAVAAQRMKLVDTRFSGTGSPYFSRPRAMLRMRKIMFSASARIIWSPSRSSVASPGFLPWIPFQYCPEATGVPEMVKYLFSSSKVDVRPPS